MNGRPAIPIAHLLLARAREAGLRQQQFELVGVGLGVCLLDQRNVLLPTHQHVFRQGLRAHLQPPHAPPSDQGMQAQGGTRKPQPVTLGVTPLPCVVDQAI